MTNVEDLSAARLNVKAQKARDQLKRRTKLTDREAKSRRLVAYQPGQNYGDIAPGDWGVYADRWGMPPDCPVTPLGRNGDVCFVLTVSGTVMALGVTTQKKSAMTLAFSPFTNYLMFAWPRWDKKTSAWDTRTFDAEACFVNIVDACSRRMAVDGPWDERLRLRGRGVWRLDDGRTAIHLGTRVLIDDQVHEAGEIGGVMFAAKEAIVGPAAAAELPVFDRYGPGGQLHELLQTWNWQRHDIDPYLMLGWIGQAYVSGVLDWRSICWLIGGAGTGKSTAMFLIQTLLCGLGRKAEDATAAAVYRGMGGDAGAAILDESESHDGRKASALVDLSRQAASGALVERAGGPNGQVQQFPVKSSFMFAAINPPAMQSADYSRVLMLQLKPLPAMRTGLGEWEDRAFTVPIGQLLFGRMVAMIDVLPQVIKGQKLALMQGGHTSRSADTFATPLACAHVLHNDDPIDSDLWADWAKMLAPGKLIEMQMTSSNWADCWDVMLSASPMAWARYKSKSLRALLVAFRDEKNLEAALEEKEGQTSPIQIPDRKALIKRLRERLGEVGLGLKFTDRYYDYDSAQLFVPTNTRSLQALTRDTEYAGRGQLTNALRQMPEEWIEINVVGRVGGTSMRGTAIHLAKALPVEDDDDDE